MENAITERTPLSIVVTGADTPLGQVVTRRLTNAGHQVAGLATGASGGALVRANGGLPVYADPTRAGELKGIIALRKADVVINLSHQLANHVPMRSADWNEDKLEAATAALIEAAIAGGAKFYLHTSYAFVYGDSHGNWVDETTHPAPGDFGLLKAALRAEKKALSADIPGCVLRLGYLYGAETSELQAIADTIRAGRALIAGDGYANWIHLEDAAEAIRRAAEARIKDGIYNITDGQPATPEAFLGYIATGLGMRAPSPVRGFAARALLPKNQLDLMALSTKVKNTRASDDLGWSPRFADYTNGLSDVFLTWRSTVAE